MDPLQTNATPNTPALSCDPAAGGISIAGESYPENAASLFQPLLDWVHGFLTQEGHIHQPMVVDIDLKYFNSATSRILMQLFDLLDAAARDGRDVVVNWHHHAHNEMAEEYGEEFREDLQYLSFNLLPYDDAAD